MDTRAQLIAALPAFVTSDPEARPGLVAPFSVEFEGERWACATDGRRLLAVRGDHGFPLWSDAVPTAPDAAQVLIRPKSQAVPVSIAALRAFAGVPTDTPEPCPTCDGEGRITCAKCEGQGSEPCTCHCGDDHDAECADCDGSGTLPCPTCKPHEQQQLRPARIGGSMFCRNVVGRATAALPDVPALWAQDAPERAGWLFGDGWVVLMMPLRDTGQTGVPVFDLSAAEARA
jgi:hypothetical protein